MVTDTIYKENLKKLEKDLFFISEDLKAFEDVSDVNIRKLVQQKIEKDKLEKERLQKEQLQKDKPKRFLLNKRLNVYLDNEELEKSKNSVEDEDNESLKSIFKEVDLSSKGLQNRKFVSMHEYIELFCEKYKIEVGEE